MSDVKRKAERILVVNIKRPSVECLCDEEGLVIRLYYGKEVSTRRLPGSFLSDDDLYRMEYDIGTAFDDIPFFDMTGLINIVEWMLRENLFPVVEVV
ncbi:hypothetical protein ES703_44434 [subsurface metagenome]